MFTSLWQWLYDVPLIGTVRDSQFAFPILECFHLYSMVFLLAMVVMFDLRLMGVSWAKQCAQRGSQRPRAVSACSPTP